MYINSEKLTIYPISNTRNPNDGTNIITEANIANYSANLFSNAGKDGFVIDYDPASHFIKFYIKGYYIEADITDLPLRPLYASIAIDDASTCNSYHYIEGSDNDPENIGEATYVDFTDQVEVGKPCLQLLDIEGKLAESALVKLSQSEISELDALTYNSKVIVSSADNGKHKLVECGTTTAQVNALSNLTKNRVVITDNTEDPVCVTSTDVTLGEINALDAINTDKNKVLITDPETGYISTTNATKEEVEALHTLTADKVMTTNGNGYASTCYTTTDEINAIHNLNNSIVIVTDNQGNLASSTITSAQLNSIGNITKNKVVVADNTGDPVKFTSSSTSKSQVDALSSLTKNRVVITSENSGGEVEVATSSISTTELGTLSGINTNNTIQTQLNNKSNSNHTHGNITSGGKIGTNSDQVVITGAQGALTTKSLQEFAQLLGNIMYPVGSLYMSTNSTSPANIFGGIWERWGKGRVPVGVDENDSYFKPNSDGTMKTGGSKDPTLPSHEHYYNVVTGVKEHQLTLDQIPAHNHNRTIRLTTDIRLTDDDGVAVDNPTAQYYVEKTRTWTTNSDIAAAGVNEVDQHTYKRLSTVVKSNKYMTRLTHQFNTGDVNRGSGGAHTHGINSDRVSTTSAGAATSGTNLQPYITCYMWKRTE